MCFFVAMIVFFKTEVTVNMLITLNMVNTVNIMNMVNDEKAEKAAMNVFCATGL